MREIFRWLIDIRNKLKNSRHAEWRTLQRDRRFLTNQYQPFIYQRGEDLLSQFLRGYGDLFETDFNKELICMNFIFDYLHWESRCCNNGKLRNSTTICNSFDLLNKYQARVDYGICLRIILIALFDDNKATVYVFV